VTQVISVRLPPSLAPAVAAGAENGQMPISEALDLLLPCSFDGSEIFLSLEDCPGLWTSKVDVRLPVPTVDSLKFVCHQLGIPLSVYVRKLLYHFYLSKKIWVVEKDGHYKLAGGHDKT